MLCRKPFVPHPQSAFGCGQCLPCRLNKRREWTHRIVLEQKAHQDNAFITLTYDDENLPDGATLVPEHVKDWLKRLRRRVYPHRLRYFYVGEYGDKSERPHYHVALFGYPHCIKSRNLPKCAPQCNCVICETISSTWQMGRVDVGTLTRDSAQYIAAYTVKKMTNPNNEKVKQWLNGRHPEFARMSLKPGIGALAIDSLAEALETEHGCDFLHESGDVPRELRCGNRKFPIARYLRKKLRLRMGMDEKTPEALLHAHNKEMQELYEAYQEVKKTKEITYEKFLADLDEQKFKNIKRKIEIFKSEKIL